MPGAEARMKEALDKRISAGNLRQLRLPDDLIDFCSNDYLGLAGMEHKPAEGRPGSGGSRLLSGNSPAAEELETFLAAFHKAPSALLFNSGYMANLAFFSSVPGRHDTVLYDESIHASVKDGTRLGLAKAYSFAHNDLNDLEQKIKKAEGNCFIAVESVYSMSGDFCPLPELVYLAKHYNASIFLDEAHSNGLYGPSGEGFAVEAGLEKSISARLMSFGKAIGVHGACICGSKTLKDYLVNFARPFIYTTAMPEVTIRHIQEAYAAVAEAHEARLLSQENINLFIQAAADSRLNILPSGSAIQGIPCPGNTRARALSLHLRNGGFDARPILSPTVPEGSERIRVVLHAYNTAQQIKNLVYQASKFVY